MRARSVAVLLAACLALGGAWAADAKPALEGLRQEVNERSQALVQQGFNLTQGMRLQGRGGAPTRVSLVLPPMEGERRLTVWLAVLDGEAQLSLRGPGPANQAPLFSWVARQGETSLQRVLPAGRYELEVDGTASEGGFALLGVKGAALVQPRLDATKVQEVAAAATQGFHWPYYLYLPQQIKSPHLLVVPNNSGFVSEDLALLRASAASELNQQSALAERLGVPLLVPMFPRPADAADPGAEDLYLHALSRAALQATRAEWRRVDRQLLAMVDDARQRLAQQGKPLSARMLMSGFSASGSFVNRFAFLHPERVLALASGSPGGWPLAPLAELDGVPLNYPVGVADLATLTGAPWHKRALQSVAAFVYMGDQDENDAVVHRDSFSAADERLIFAKFGATPLARWQRVQQLYAEQGLDTRFALYPGVAHSVTAQMQADIAAFFEQRLAGAGPR